MRICVVSASHEVRGLLTCKSPCTLLTALPGEPIPSADLFIWDCTRGFIPDPHLLSTQEGQHLLLAEQEDLTDLEQLQEFVCVLLKPVSALRLRAFVDLALNEWQFRKRAHEVDSLRSDRDRLLQYVLEVNLKLQEYDQERTNFLARALHDFRAPLTALHGYCGLLAEGKVGAVNPLQEGLLERMRNSTRRLSRLANGALELLAEGRFQKEPKVSIGDLAETLNQALHEIDPLVKEKELALEIQVEPAGTRLLFEAEQIQQVLVNLLENSCKFTPKGGRIRVKAFPTRFEFSSGIPELHADSSLANAYQVQILDSGPGISHELVEKIFEQWASYGGGADRSVGGLGLAICRSIVVAHGGCIWANAQETGGHFAFVLPLCVMNEPVSDQAFAAVASDAGRLSS